MKKLLILFSLEIFSFKIYYIWKQKLIYNLVLTYLYGINDYYIFNSYDYIILYYNDFEIILNDKKWLIYYMKLIKRSVKKNLKDILKKI